MLALFFMTEVSVRIIDQGGLLNDIYAYYKKTCRPLELFLYGFSLSCSVLRCTWLRVRQLHRKLRIHGELFGLE